MSNLLFTPLNYWLKKIYYEEKTQIHSFCVRLGDFVSHKLIKDENYNLLPVYVLNKIDRYNAAKYFVDVDCHESSYYGDMAEKYEKDYKDGREGFLADIAYEIDHRIPRAYKKNYYHDGDRGPAATPFREGEFGLYTQYPLNPMESRKLLMHKPQKEKYKTEVKTTIRLSNSPLATSSKDGPIKCDIRDIPHIDELEIEIMGKITNLTIKTINKSVIYAINLMDHTGQIEVAIFQTAFYNYRNVINTIIYEDLNAYVYGIYSEYYNGIILTRIEDM